MHYTADRIAAGVDALADRQWEGRCSEEERMEALAECLDDAKDERMGSPDVVASLLGQLAASSQPIKLQEIHALADNCREPTIAQALAILGLSENPVQIWGALQVLRPAMMKLDEEQISDRATELATERGLIAKGEEWPL